MSHKKILCVVGARPNFMKIAPIMRAFNTHAPGVEAKLVHTGQHYDYAMNESFFQQLDIAAPDISLNVGSSSHAQQTAEIMMRFEPVLNAEKPECVLVVGDVNSTIACALVAAKKNIKVVHVEAGLRSGDRRMPEEINRVLTDQISDRLYVTERDAVDNLVAEGVRKDSIVFAGNVMIDTLLHSLPRAVPAQTTIADACENPVTGPLRNIQTFNDNKGYAVLTLHRPSNVDNAEVLGALLGVLAEVSDDLPLVFPVHPRTQAKIRDAGYREFLENPRILALPPIGYLEMLGLMKSAKVVLTDSGGLQEETTALGVPCLTLRENTERPITITEGTNTRVGLDAAKIRASVGDLMTGHGKAGRQPEYWDGKAAERIGSDLQRWLST